MQQQGSSGVSWSSVHSKITDEIIEAIARGADEFAMPWHRRGSFVGRPVNAASRMPYRGVNVIALWVATEKRCYDSSVWATYRQWKALDGQVRKDEKGTVIVYFKEVEWGRRGQKPHRDDSDTMLVARPSWVFNGDQVEGWRAPEPEVMPVAEVMTRAEELVGASGAHIEWGGEYAGYHPTTDVINMPDREFFVATSTSHATENYYATLLHELTRWTGHASRLNRDLSDRFGDDTDAMEELATELGAAFLCADLCITNTPRLDYAAYVTSWLKVLRDDARAIFTVAAKASAAADYLIGLHVQGFPIRQVAAQ
jgi:antirestriction protein ArdC